MFPMPSFRRPARQVVVLILSAIAQFSIAGISPQGLFATEESFRAASFLPDTAIGYVEITHAPEILSTVLDHPIAAHIQTLDVWKKATREKAYRDFLTGRKFFEVQIGSEWRPAIESITAGGMCVAYDGDTRGVVALVRGKDADTMENFRVKILELTRLSMRESEIPEPYRELPVYKLEKGGAVVVKEWLVITNNSDLGKKVVDKVLDQSDGDANAAGTLASSTTFKTAYEKKPEDAVAWGYLDMNSIRLDGNVQKALEQQSENPLAELLVGGLQSTLKNTPYLTAVAKLDRTQLLVEFGTPLQSDWIPESRTFFFGPDLSGKANQPPELPETLFTLSTYRNVSDMWLRAGDLFNEQMNDSLAEADSTLSTIFSGKDFGEDILASFRPEFGIVAVRQNFANLSPVPTIKLPSFALVASMKDPETMRPDLRRMFQNAIGFFNIVGAQEGNPQLEMDMLKEGDVDMITSRYLPDKKIADVTSAPMIYNFSPSVAFRGSRFVLASTSELAKNLVTARLEDQPSDSNTTLQLSAGSLKQVLDDNREQLISQNMLEEGHSREEAEAAIGLLLELIGHVKGAGIDLHAANNAATLKFRFSVIDQVAR